MHWHEILISGGNRNHVSGFPSQHANPYTTGMLAMKRKFWTPNWLEGTYYIQRNNTKTLNFKSENTPTINRQHNRKKHGWTVDVQFVKVPAWWPTSKWLSPRKLKGNYEWKRTGTEFCSCVIMTLYCSLQISRILQTSGLRYHEINQLSVDFVYGTAAHEFDALAWEAFFVHVCYIVTGGVELGLWCC